MIPNKQIGWSQEENLLWQISKQLDRMDSILCTGPCPTTTTTSTTLPTMCYCYTVESTTVNLITIDWIGCDGIPYNFTSRTLSQPLNVCAQEGTLIVTCEDPYIISGGTSICTIDQDCATICNCREVASLIQPYDFYDCLGTHYICPEVGACKIPSIVCIDISQPYSGGVVPSETVTANCNCNPV